MAIIRYKGKTTDTTPNSTKVSKSTSDASSSRIASERAARGAVSSSDVAGETAAQRKARLGVIDTPVGGVEQGPMDPTQTAPQTGLPTATQPTSPAVPFAEAIKGVDPKDHAKLGSIAQQYQQGFNQTMASGAPAPATAGMAAPAIQSTLPPAEADTSIIDTALAEDKGWTALQEQYTEYFSPENQKVSLMDTYNKLFKKSGLDQLDEEILDAKTVIEGTEDDIRNEVEQAGGFGTDSQVQALALSRNKVLLKNYNNLVALRESKATNLDRMLTLAEKDRAYADSQFDRMLDFQTQMLSYRDKFVQNARDQYNKYTPQQLTAMLAGNPRQLAFAEKILGVGQGGIAKLAAAPLSEEEQLNLELKRSALLTDKAQRANIYKNIERTQQEIDLTNNPVGGVDPKTFAKIQSAPEYKTITGVLPAMAAVKSYLDAVKDTGSFELLNGAKSGNLKSTYGNAIAAWKTLAALGALSGADFGLAENVIPAPSLWTRNSKVESQLTSAIDNAITQADIMTRRLSQNYPGASTLLNQQLDDMKVTAHPETFIRAPDGQVIELTD